MIDIKEALTILKNNKGSFNTELIPLFSSTGRILKENWYTDRALPPYDRVTMDGICIAFKDYKAGQRVFQIAGIAAAGDEQQTLSEAHSCLEVMTGAIMPLGCDTVIKYEDLHIENNKATIVADQINESQNVHFKGSDRKINELVVKENTLISSAEIGMAASIGKTMVKVAKLPKAIAISTGNELIPVDQTPLAHQIRKSNVYRIKTALESYHIKCDIDHLDDHKEVIKEKLRDYLETYDLILLSGGVSKGRFDFIPEVLAELGAQKLFHKIAQRPGKPFWFGRFQNKCSIFAFPGNPVSSFVCMQRYFLFWLSESLGAALRKSYYAALTHEVEFKPDLSYFLEVKISCSDAGQLLATPQKGNGSGDLSNLVEADAIIELPRGKNRFNKGEVYPIYLYK